MITSIRQALLHSKLADPATSGATTQRALQLMEDVICGTK